MATVRDSVPHVVRTSDDPRQTGLYNVTLSHIEEVNPMIRLLRLRLPREGPPLRHLPGQYVDLHIPNLPQVGGFTITSSPSTAIPRPPASLSSEAEHPYIELAIQRSRNPPAQHLWQASPTILNTPFQFRVGGAFVYPPPLLSKTKCEAITRVLLIAGGVGINPIMSILSALHELGTNGRFGGLGMPQQVRVMYGTKWTGDEDGSGVLFYTRIRRIVEQWQQKNGQNASVLFDVYQTDSTEAVHPASHKTDMEDHQQQSKNDERNDAIRHFRRRMTTDDLLDALGSPAGHHRAKTVAYVCGLPGMTDEFVAFLQAQDGMEDTRVLCEKWW